MVTIVYWSGTGNTEAMANEIEAAAKGAGAEVEKCYLTIHVDAVAGKDVYSPRLPRNGRRRIGRNGS